jgi:hypothetical protein
MIWWIIQIHLWQFGVIIFVRLVGWANSFFAHADYRYAWETKLHTLRLYQPAYGFGSEFAGI